ncbi:hypothetical protein ACXYFN_01745 [Mycoplasma sp. 48589B]
MKISDYFTNNGVDKSYRNNDTEVKMIGIIRMFIMVNIWTNQNNLD